MTEITSEFKVFADPRTNEWTMAEALRARLSPARFDVREVWKTLVDGGVDPAFGLAQYWAESLYGTAGWAVITTSWGNILYPNTTISESVEYIASNGYHYAKYENIVDSVRDYVGLLKLYNTLGDDPRYGDITKIYGATAKWIGKTPGSEEHERYIDAVIWRMNQYANPETQPKAGERVINAGKEGIATQRRYLLRKGTPLHEMPGASPYTTYQGNDTRVRYIGNVNNTSWGAIVVKTKHGTISRTLQDMIVYVSNVRDVDVV